MSKRRKFSIIPAIISHRLYVISELVMVNVVIHNRNVLHLNLQTNSQNSCNVNLFTAIFCHVAPVYQLAVLKLDINRQISHHIAHKMYII